MSLDAEMNVDQASPLPVLPRSIPPLQSRIAHELILRFAGALIMLLGISALVGVTFHQDNLITPVPGFAPMSVAAAVALVLFGFALVVPIGGKWWHHPLIGIAMLLLALTSEATTSVLDRGLVGFAALTIVIHGKAMARSRTVAMAVPALLALVALLLVARSVPTIPNPDPAAGASAQWTLGALIGGTALLGAVAARLLGGIPLHRRLPWLVWLSLSLLVVSFWFLLVAAKDRHIATLVDFAADDAAQQMTRRVDRLVLSATQGDWSEAATAAAPNSWDSLVPGVIGIATERDNHVVVSRARTPTLVTALDSLARSEGMRTGALVPLDPIGEPLRLVAIRGDRLEDGSAVTMVVDVDSLFRDVVASPAQSMNVLIRTGPGPVPLQDSRRFLASRDLQWPGLAATLEVWPARRLLLSLRSILPELLLFGGLAFAALTALALVAAIRTQELERTFRLQGLVSALSDGEYPRFRYEWDMPSGRVIRDTGLLLQLGYEVTEQATTAEDWRALIAPGDRPVVDAAFAAHARGHTDAALVMYRVCAADGRWHRWADRMVITERNRDGTPRHVSGLCADMGLEDLAQDPAADLDRRLRHAAAQAVELQALFRGDDTLVIASPGADAWFRSPRNGNVGQDLLATASTEARDALAGLWRDAHAKGRARGDVALLDVTGEPRIVDMALHRLGLEDQPHELLLQMRDVTLLRAAERRRVESRRLQLLGRLSGRLAHEINNPLGGIRNAAALLLRIGDRPQDRERLARTIDVEVGNIARVIRHLYETLDWGDLTRLEANLAEVVEGVAQTLGTPPAGVRLVVNLDPDARVVPAPEAVVRLVVYTILRNAYNASPDGGTVTISSSREREDIVLHVDDDGPGIPREERESRLAPGSRRSGARNDLVFGLPFAREVVEAFGGSLDIGDAPGRGARLTVCWPAMV